MSEEHGIADSEERIFVAGQMQLMWWRFRKHRVAVVAAIVVVAFYVVVLGADFLAYTNPNTTEAFRSLMPPQPVRLFDNGRFSPHVYAVSGKRDLRTFKRVYVADPDQKLPVRLFVRGFKYKFLGFIPTDRHLIGVEGATAAESLFLLGTDEKGRDVWSRMMVATRTSLTIGLVAVALSLVLGVLLGGISGFYGGAIDSTIQRLIEILRSIPTIPLWMGMAAAFPRDWSVEQIYFAITIVIALRGWTGLAREVRGQVSFPARGGLCDGGGLGRLQPQAHHIPAHDTLLPEPYHRRRHSVRPGHDPGGDGVELSGIGSAPTGPQLGRHAATGAECRGRRVIALAAGLGRPRDRRDPGLQLHGRWSARRCRPVWRLRR